MVQRGEKSKTFQAGLILNAFQQSLSSLAESLGEWSTRANRPTTTLLQHVFTISKSLLIADAIQLLVYNSCCRETTDRNIKIHSLCQLLVTLQRYPCICLTTRWNWFVIVFFQSVLFYLPVQSNTLGMSNSLLTWLGAVTIVINQFNPSMLHRTHLGFSS